MYLKIVKEISRKYFLYFFNENFSPLTGDSISKFRILGIESRVSAFTLLVLKLLIFVRPAAKFVSTYCLTCIEHPVVEK